MADDKPDTKSQKPYTKADATTPTVVLKTPHGAAIRVPRRRADALLKRGAIEMPGGKTAKWERVSPDTKVKQPYSNEPTGEGD